MGLDTSDFKIKNVLFLSSLLISKILRAFRPIKLVKYVRQVMPLQANYYTPTFLIVKAGHFSYCTAVKLLLNKCHNFLYHKF